MNKLSLSAVLFLATALASYAATDRTTDKPATSYVNTMIGTSGMGHTFPGACAPFGIVQLSPETDTIPHSVNGKYQLGRKLARRSSARIPPIRLSCISSCWT